MNASLELPALTILVIDPDPRSCVYLGNLLTQRGCTVQTTTSAKEGYIFALRDQPDVVIFDPSVSDMPPLELVKRLRNDRRTSQTMLTALAGSFDTALMGALLAAGCSDYLPKSSDSLDKLLRLLSGADRQTAETQPAGGSARRKTHGGILAVFLSAKGGTGTSSMCANIAQTLSVLKPEMEMAVMDLVLPIGSIGPIVGYQGDFNLLKAAEHPLEDLNSDYLRRAMPPLEMWNFRLLAGAPDPEAANRLDAARIPVLINGFRRAFDATFVDLGRSLSRISLPIIQEADLIVMVTSSDQATATLTQTVWQYFNSKGVDQHHVYMLLNRAVGLEGLSKSDVEKIVGLPVNATIPYMAANLSLANNQHIPVLKKMPTDTAAMMIEQVSRQILEAASQNRA